GLVPDGGDYTLRIVSTWVGKALPLAGGTMTGDIAMGGSKVTGQGEPDTAKDGLRYGHAEIRNNEIKALAAIVYSKLNLTGTLLMADLATTIKNAAAGLAVLDASADVPLAQIPDTLTGKDADTLDGLHLAALGPSVKLETRDMTAASGAVAYTGYGFEPSGLIIIAYVNTTRVSIGSAEPAGAEQCIWVDSDTPYGVAKIFRLGTGSTYQDAVLTTFDA
ncbi:unnamed protein product, partial [marine sediment metagenome]